MATTKAEGVAFDVHLTGDITGKTWDGSFRAKPTLTHRDRILMDRARRELLGGDGTTNDPEMAATALVIAELGVRLTEAPEWWKESKGGLDLADLNILRKVYEGVKRIETDYFEKMEAEAKAAQEKLRSMSSKG